MKRNAVQFSGKQVVSIVLLLVSLATFFLPGVMLTEEYAAPMQLAANQVDALSSMASAGGLDISPVQKSLSAFRDGGVSPIETATLAGNISRLAKRGSAYAQLLSIELPESLYTTLSVIRVLYVLLLCVTAVLLAAVVVGHILGRFSRMEYLMPLFYVVTTFAYLGIFVTIGGSLRAAGIGSAFFEGSIWLLVGPVCAIVGVALMRNKAACADDQAA